MKKRYIALAAAVVLLWSLTACKKEEEKPIMRAPLSQAPHSTVAPGMTGRTGEVQIVVPEEVRGTWSAVRLSIEDKQAGTSEDVTVGIGEQYAIPGSNLTVTVGQFLPHFQMQGGIITSGSNEPVMPSVAIKVLEGDTQVFPSLGKEWGWLFSKMPAIHAFEHEKYGISLIEGVKKG